MHDSPEHGGGGVDSPLILPEVARYYGEGVEALRLSGSPEGRLELIRTQELLRRYLPPSPATVLDVGGGPGIYACWLAELGYNVHLIDALSIHVHQAEVASSLQPEHPLQGCSIGDARRLGDVGDGCVDAVLLMGPLYHILEHDERIQALQEAYRVLKPGGVALAAAISRYASVLDGLRQGFALDPQYRGMIERDLADGQHRNPTPANPEYFTTAYLHQPAELRREIAMSGLVHQATLAVEGPAWLLANLNDYLRDQQQRELLLETLRSIESEPALIGASSHLLAVARKPDR